MTPSGSGINCYFNNGNVTGDIYLTFYLEDVLYYFYITDKTNDSDLRPQLSMDVDKYFIDTIHIIKTISNGDYIQLYTIYIKQKPDND